jgi:hypothetical protein
MFKQINGIENGFNPQTIGEKLGIKFNSDPSIITGKQLNLPELLLGDKERIDENKASSFMLFNKYLFSHDITLKVCVFYPLDFDFGSIKKLMESTCSNLGLQFKLSNNSINYGDYKTALRNIENIITA